MPDLGCWGGEICKECPPGAHITLRCKEHPDKEWQTKNIGYIGARNIFFNLMSKPGMGGECACSGSLLHHDHTRDPYKEGE